MHFSYCHAVQSGACACGPNEAQTSQLVECVHEPGLRCMECVTDDEWSRVTSDQANEIAEQINWTPASQVTFCVPSPKSVDQ